MYWESKFDDLAMPVTETGCWEWLGSNNLKGYAQLSTNGHTHGAHRLSYQRFKGTVPKGLFVMHLCDNRNCVNPDHLTLGTHQDNTNDMRLKGRHARYKLSDSDIKEIRVLLGEGVATQTEIAKRYGIDPSNVSRIKSGYLHKLRRV